MAELILAVALLAGAIAARLYSTAPGWLTWAFLAAAVLFAASLVTYRLVRLVARRRGVEV